MTSKSSKRDRQHETSSSDVENLLDLQTVESLLTGRHDGDNNTKLRQQVTQVRQSVSVLSKLNRQRHKLPIVGERRVQVFNVALEAVMTCLILIHGRRRESRRYTIYHLICHWLALILEFCDNCAVDLEVLVFKAGRLFVDLLPPSSSQHYPLRSGSSVHSSSFAENGQTGIKIVWTFGEAMSQSSGSNGARLFYNLGRVISLSILAHCCEMLVLHDCIGIAEIPETQVLLQQQQHQQQQHPTHHNRDLIRFAFSWISRCPPSHMIYEQSSLLIHGLGKLLQQTVYRSSEEEGSGDMQGGIPCPMQDLVSVLSQSTKFGWIVKEVHTVGAFHQNDNISSEVMYLHEPERPFNPWQSAKLNLEVVFEFLLQRPDALGLQGLSLVNGFLNEIRYWSQLSQESHNNFVIQVSVVVLRSVAPHLISAVDRARERMSHSKPLQREDYDEELMRRYLKGLLSVLTKVIEISFKYDRQQQHLGAAASSTGHLSSMERGNGAPYLLKQRSLRTIYLSNYEKTFVDCVGTLIIPFFRFAASFLLVSGDDSSSFESQRKSGSFAQVLLDCVNACFARVGTSDVHWAAVRKNSDLLSEYEVWAAILRCGMWSGLTVHANLDSHVQSKFESEALQGILCALHELAKNDAGSIQSQIHQARKFGSPMAGSGEYTISLCTGRLVGLIFFINKVWSQRLQQQQQQQQGAPMYPNLSSSGSSSHPIFDEFGTSKLAALMPVLSERAGNAKLVHELPLETLLAWVPAIGITLGASSDVVGRASGAALLELIKAITLRGLFAMESDNDTIESNEEQKRERGENLDALMLRLLEIWHTLFATGTLPSWFLERGESGQGRLDKGDPAPFSATYGKDLMLMLTQQKKDWGKGAPDWFRPLAARRQIEIIVQSLETELRSTLLPFRTGQSEFFIHGSERAAYSFAGQLVLPRLETLCNVLESWSIAWKLGRYQPKTTGSSIVSTATQTPSFQAFFLSKQSGMTTDLGDKTEGGVLGKVAKALQHIAEVFVSYNCLRGRIGAAYYTHLSAQLARDAGDLWEAGNAFAMVANCIMSGNHQSTLVDEHDESDPYTSIAILFLEESIAIFNELGAGAEADRIEKIYETIRPEQYQQRKGTLQQKKKKKKQKAPEEVSSFYFCVGTNNVSTSLVQSHFSIGLAPLNVIRMVIPQNDFGIAETILIDRLNHHTGLRHVYGSLEWVGKREWVDSSTSTLSKSQIAVVPQMALLETSSQDAIDRNTDGNNNKLENTFWVRRLWPTSVRENLQWEHNDHASASASLSSATKRSQMLRCPTEFVLLPNKLDRSIYTENWMVKSARFNEDGLTLGHTLALDRLILCSTDHRLSPLIGIAPVKARLLPPSAPPLKDILDRSSYGVPINEFGEQLGPIFDPTEEGRSTTNNVDDSEDDDDSTISSLSSPPRPPAYPPPADENEEGFFPPPPSSPPPPEEETTTTKPDQDSVTETVEKASPKSSSYLSKRQAALRKLALAQQGESVGEPSQPQAPTAQVGQATQQDPVRLMMPPPAPPLEVALVSPKEEPESQQQQGDDEEGKEDELLPPVPPKPAHLLNNNSNEVEGTEEGETEEADEQVVEETKFIEAEFTNPLITNEEGSKGEVEDNVEAPTTEAKLKQIDSSQASRKTEFKEMAGIKLSPRDYDTVKKSLTNQEATFSILYVDKGGLKEGTIRIMGTNPKSPGTKRRASLIQRASRGASMDDDGANELKNVMQISIGKSSSHALIRRNSKSFKLMHQIELEHVSIDEASIPGTIRINSEERQRKGENPILVQLTDSNPSMFLSTMTKFKQQITPSPIL